MRPDSLCSRIVPADIVAALCLAPTMLVTRVAPAQTPTMTSNPLWYYEIGGAAAVSPPANAHYTRTDLSAGGTLRWGYGCGRWDAVLAVENILNKIAKDAEDMLSKMVLAAQAAIGQLPAYVLQRANPGLYDLFMNGLLKAEETVNIAFKDCQTMEREIARGENPYDDWIRISMNHRWRSELNDPGAISGGDIVEARDLIERQGGDAGVPWIGGDYRGGAGQPPIRVVGDIVTAGYNVLVNRAGSLVDTSTPEPGSFDTPPRLLALFADPDSARDWAVTVLGERHVTTCHDCPKDTTPGTGLLLGIDRERREIARVLGELTTGLMPLTLESTTEVSAPGVAIDSGIIHALQRLPPPDRALAMARFANEVATARVMEKALLVRRLMLTGRRVPEVQAADAALEAIGEAIAELEGEVETLAFEKRIRQDLVSQTAQALLRLDSESNRRSLSQPRRPAADPLELRDGALIPQRGTP